MEQSLHCLHYNKIRVNIWALLHHKTENSAETLKKAEATSAPEAEALWLFQHNFASQQMVYIEAEIQADTLL